MKINGSLSQPYLNTYTQKNNGSLKGFVFLRITTEESFFRWKWFFEEPLFEKVFVELKMVLKNHLLKVL